MKKLRRILIILISASAVFAAVFLALSRTGDRYDHNKAFSEAKPADSGENGDMTDLLADAKEINRDTVAWIEIPDTDVDFPIVRGTDNFYYLKHSFLDKEARFGVPFLDCRYEKDFSDFNPIVYGHNIDGRWMFAHILDFKKQDYLESHPYGVLTTSNHVYKVNFICCCVVKSDSKVYDAVFLTDDERLSYVEFLRENAVTKTDFRDEEMAGKHLLVLSTCSYEFKDARTVLVGYLE